LLLRATLSSSCDVPLYLSLAKHATPPGWPRSDEVQCLTTTNHNQRGEFATPATIPCAVAVCHHTPCLPSHRSYQSKQWLLCAHECKSTSDVAHCSYHHEHPTCTMTRTALNSTMTTCTTVCTTPRTAHPMKQWWSGNRGACSQLHPLAPRIERGIPTNRARGPPESGEGAPRIERG
jgi:hypothetical protein